MTKTLDDTQDVAAIDSLAALSAPYSALSPADDSLFAKAMAQCDHWHRRYNPSYLRLCEGEHRPTVPIGLFKRVDLGTPVHAPGTWLSSSGTGPKGKTRVFFDESSLARIQQAMFQMFIEHRFVDLEPAHFLLLSPNPESAKGVGYATAFEKFTACAPNHERVYAVSDSGEFQPEVAWDALRRWSSEEKTIFIFGLSVFFERLVLAGKAPLRQNGAIKVLTGGGWKGLERKLTRPEMVERFHGLFPHGAVDIRDLFGLTEHPLHYLSCPHGRFHIPKYSRFTITGKHGEPLPEGEMGMIRLMNPFFGALPSHDLLTEDTGKWGTACECGSELPFFEFLGRATSNTGTCAYAASTNAAS